MEDKEKNEGELTLGRDIQMLRSRKATGPISARIVPEMSKEAKCVPPSDSSDITDQDAQPVQTDSNPATTIDYKTSSDNILEAVRQIGPHLTWTKEERKYVIGIVRENPQDHKIIYLIVLIVGVLVGMLISSCHRGYAPS